MKVLIVGASGEIGSAVVKDLEKDHEIIKVSHTKGDCKVDIADAASIDAMYKKIGKVDAVVSTVGKVKFLSLSEFTENDYYVGIKNKLMGQVNLVLKGVKYVNENGSFTLTSGVLSHDPIVQGTSAAMVNGAIDAFVKNAAIELKNGIRINVVSPTVLTESLPKFKDYFSGFESVPASRVALAYRKSVDGAQTGIVYCIS